MSQKEAYMVFCMPYTAQQISPMTMSKKGDEYNGQHSSRKHRVY